MLFRSPIPVKEHCAIIFRTDLVETAGLDPNKPPKTWDEFMQWAYVLTDAKKIVPGAVTTRGQRAFVMEAAGWHFLPWVQSAGGEPLVQYRTSPTTGEDFCFTMFEENFLTPSGEDLSLQPPKWRLNFDSLEALQAIDFYHRLRWEKWISV